MKVSLSVSGCEELLHFGNITASVTLRHPRLDLRQHIGQELCHRPHTEVAALLMAHGDLPSLGFLLPDDEHVGHLLQLGDANFCADLVGIQIERAAHAGGEELVIDTAREVIGLFADGHHAHLLGAEPCGECAREVLDEHAGEALHAAEGGAMDHHGAVLGVVGPGVGDILSSLSCLSSLFLMLFFLICIRIQLLNPMIVLSSIFSF